MENNTEIGKVVLNYDRYGKLTSSVFTPTMQVEIESSCIEELNHIEGGKDSDLIQSNVEQVVAKYFSKMTEIELADQTQYKIATESLDCVKYPGGKVKTCTFRIVFKSLN